jgi:hypothetical protein
MGRTSPKNVKFLYEQTSATDRPIMGVWFAELVGRNARAPSATNTTPKQGKNHNTVPFCRGGAETTTFAGQRPAADGDRLSRITLLLLIANNTLSVVGRDDSE